MIHQYHGSTVTIDHLTSRMIQILAEEQGYSLEEALELVYTSPIYDKLSDARTGLFYQSPRYVLSYIKKAYYKPSVSNNPDCQ
jgi:hypothetical protein